MVQKHRYIPLQPESSHTLHKLHICLENKAELQNLTKENTQKVEVSKTGQTNGVVFTDLFFIYILDKGTLRIWTGPSHEIMVLFILHKLIFETCMRSHPMGLHVWFLAGHFVYFYTSCVRTAKALARLRRCVGSPEPSLVTYVISTIISWAGSISIQIFPEGAFWVPSNLRHSCRIGFSSLMWLDAFTRKKLTRSFKRRFSFLKEKFNISNSNNHFKGLSIPYKHECSCIKEFIKRVGEKDKSILSVFSNEFFKFNNTGAQMQDTIYHMTLKSHFISKFCTKTSQFSHWKMWLFLWTSMHNVMT